VAEHNGLNVTQVRQPVDDHTEPRTAGFLGEPHVNVLKLNIALRELTEKS
jgi:K+-transporting ATPase ATPase C chain